MNINYLKLVKLEFHDSIKYYEQQEKGLDRKFSNDIQASINRIKNFPNSYQKYLIKLEDALYTDFLTIFYISLKKTLF